MSSIFSEGHGKQGGRYQFAEESSHDYYRQSAPRGDWRYTRNCRDDRVPLSQKEKCSTLEMSNGSSRAFERPCGVRNGRRSVDERPLHASDTHSTLVNSSDSPNSTHQPDIEMCNPVQTLKFKNEPKFSDQRPSLPIDPHSDCLSLFERPTSEKSYENKECSTANQSNGLMYARRLANDNSLDPPIRNTELEGTRKPHLKDMPDNRLRGVGDLDGAMKSGKESSLGAVGKLPVWPQDHTSWDRKELLRPRKRERPSEPPFDSPSSHHVPREYSRWGSGDFRRPNCK